MLPACLKYLFPTTSFLFFFPHLVGRSSEISRPNPHVFKLKCHEQDLKVGGSSQPASTPLLARPELLGGLGAKLRWLMQNKLQHFTCKAIS